MNKKYATYYVLDGEIKTDYHGYLGYKTYDEAELYLDWVVKFWN